MSEIYLRSRGFAPAIHAICEGLLLAAFSAGSKVCTPEILDQVFRNPRGEEPQVAPVATIDLARLAASSEPEPPALLTTLLRLAFAAIKILPPPLPVNVNELLEPQRVALRMMFPIRNFALSVGDFAAGSKIPMRPTDAAAAASGVIRVSPPELHAIPGAIDASRPVLSQPLPGAELRPEAKLQRIRPNSAALILSSSAVLAASIDFPSAAMQPANWAVESLHAGNALLAPKGSHKLARLSYALKLNSGVFHRIDAQAGALHIPASWGPMHPAANFQPVGAGWRRTSLMRLPARSKLPSASLDLRNIFPTAAAFTGAVLSHPAISSSEACQAAAPRISNKLSPLACSVTPRPVAAGAPAGEASIPVEPSLPPAHPAATLQPAGTIQRPRVPVTPFGLAACAPPSPRISGDSQSHLRNLENPVGPRIGTELAASGEPNVPEQDRLVPLTCNVAACAPPAGMPIKTFLNPLRSLLPLGPVSNLEAVNPRNSWLLLPSWTPAQTNSGVANAVVADPAAEFETALAKAGKPTGFDRKWLLTLAIPILSVIALYGLSPKMLPSTGALNQGWNRVHQAVIERAAVELREDFRTGLDDWMNRGGALPSWTSDAAGFVHPSALALYRPSLSAWPIIRCSLWGRSTRRL